MGNVLPRILIDRAAANLRITLCGGRLPVIAPLPSDSVPANDVNYAVIRHKVSDHDDVNTTYMVVLLCGRYTHASFERYRQDLKAPGTITRIKAPWCFFFKVEKYFSHPAQYAAVKYRMRTAYLNYAEFTGMVDYLTCVPWVYNDMQPRGVRMMGADGIQYAIVFRP